MNRTILPLSKLEKQLEQLLNLDAFEMFSDSDKHILYIPYMMNDALENYFFLTDCQIIGEFAATLPEDTIFDIIETDDNNPKNALIFHKSNGEILTIWFSKCYEELQFYQYHRIGHFWVNGQEHWRRLVYIIGTLYEKYTFLGESSCNIGELELLHLIEFAPFRFWSPIHESLDKDYPDTEAGIVCMNRLAQEAGDREYLRWIRLYQKLPLSFIKNILAKQLLSPKREQLYQLINEKINQASLQYALRNYGKNRDAEIEKVRTQFSERLYADGFVGEYPYFQKDSVQIIAMEEHLFTILEWEDFSFSIRGMATDKGKHYLYP